MCEDDQHIKLLKGLRGVIDAFYLDDKIKAEVQAEENTVKACGGITVCNLGYMEALKREKVICQGSQVQATAKTHCNPAFK